MAHGWVRSGMTGLRSSRAGFLRVSPAVVDPTTATGATYRSPLCTAARARATTSLPTSPAVSTLVRKVDGCNRGRGLATVGALRCISGAVHRRNVRELRLGRIHSACAPPVSAREAGLRQAHVVGRHISYLDTRSGFSTSPDTTPKKPQESTGDEEVDGKPEAEADVAEVVEPSKELKEEPRHAHIEMPSITDVGVQPGASRGQCVTLMHLMICCCFVGSRCYLPCISTCRHSYSSSSRWLQRYGVGSSP